MTTTAPIPLTEAEIIDGPLSTKGLSDLIGFHVRMANAAVQRDFNETMAEFGVTQKQFAVLKLIDENPGASQVDIAAALETDRATMMALVDRLERRDLIKRQPSKRDRRRLDLHLLPAGDILLAEGDKVLQAHEKRLHDRLPPGGSDELVRLLRLIYA